MANKTSSSHRLLVVENQHEISHLLQPALDKMAGGLEVIHAPSGEEAFLFGSFTRIDLLITEYQLPGMTGIELMQKLRRQQPAARVILVSHISDPATVQAVTAAGADAAFIKPFELADLLSTVKQYLAIKQPVSPPLQATPPQAESPQPTLASLLADLRQKVNARALLLVDSHGTVLARAGDLPELEAEVPLLSSLLSIQSAGEKISHLLGQEELSGWSVFDRGAYDLVFAPLGAEHALLATGQGLADKNQLLSTMDALRQSRTPILASIFEKIEPLPSPDTASEQDVFQSSNGDQANGNLESLLDRLDQVPQPTEVDEFWNAAVSNHVVPLNPDTISYDQARQLGLAPGEDA